MQSYYLTFRIVTVLFLLIQSAGPAVQKEFVPFIQYLAGNSDARPLYQVTETEIPTPPGTETPTGTETATEKVVYGLLYIN